MRSQNSPTWYNLTVVTSVSDEIVPAAVIRKRPQGLGAKIRRRVFLVLVLTLFGFGIPSEGYLGADRTALVANLAVGDQGFRLGAWEVQAIEQKVHDFFAHPGDELSATKQHDLVITYFRTIDKVNDLSGQIEAIHADPAQTSPNTAAAPLQAELDAVRAEQAARRPAVEWILQRQVSTVLTEAGLGSSGRVWPPVVFQLTEGPDQLIISPRDHILVQETILMAPDQAVSNEERVEAEAERQPNVSALVEGIGGLGAYPTMVIPVSDLSWVADTVAHEWTHNYLEFWPLGWHYEDNGDTRTLNETVATIVGGEIGQAVLRRYYSELVPPPPPPPAKSGLPAAAAKPSFDYGQTMRETRLHIDDLLAKGRVSEAEAYMEQQRRVLWDHGYRIRKLNQAYFAFHGSYAVGPGATDPIGDKLRALRQRTPNLLAFVRTVAGVTSVKELDAALARGS
jgi:hypothetical protein